MPKKPELESALEMRCVARIEALGGLALKLQIPGVRGFPDRSCFMPKERFYDGFAFHSRARPTFFVEFKRLKTGRVSAQQVHWKRVLEGLEFAVYVIDTDEQFDAVLEKFR